MKNIKLFILFLTVFVLFSCLTVSGQDDVCMVSKVLNKSQLTEIEKAVNVYWNAKTNNEHKKAVEILEEIAKKEPDNWVAPYWVAYVSTQVLNADAKETQYLEKAKNYIEKSEKAFTKKPDNTAIPYFHALKSLIYRFESFRFRQNNDTANFEIFRNKSIDELNNGLKISPDNPVLLVLAATHVGSRDQPNHWLNVAAVALLEKAKNEFKKVENRSPADITYWNEHWIKFWVSKLSVKNNNSNSPGRIYY